MQEIFFRNLKLIRVLFQFTAEELGEKIGVSRQTISYWETGAVPFPKYGYLAIRYVLENECLPCASIETILTYEELLENPNPPYRIAGKRKNGQYLERV